MDIIYPSADFPGPPSLRMAVPNGWRPMNYPDAALAVVDPESPEGVTVNLVVTINRIVGDQSLAEVADIQLADTTVDLGGQVERRAEEPVAGYPAVWAALSYPPRGERRVSLFQAYTTLLVPRRARVADVVTMIATCPAALAEHYGAVFRAAFLSLVIAE